MLTRETIEEAFVRMNSELDRLGVRAECYLVGGAVMCVALNARASTKDVDGWFTEPRTVRRVARTVAESMDLPEDWLNDAAKAFIPPNARFEAWLSMTHLDVCVADVRTLLAMKCAAARTQEDAADIRFLTTRLGLQTSAAVLEVVLAYYPAARLPVRTQLLLEEMLDDCE